MNDFIRRVGQMAGGAMLVLGCQGDQFSSPAIPEIDDVFWDLRLDQHAIMLSTSAPYDTLTITATPRSHTKAALAGLPSPEYVSTDTRRVVVTADGKLIGLSPTTPGSYGAVKVIATLSAGNLKHADTAYVKVVENANPPRLGSISITPALPDSTKRAVNAQYIAWSQLLRNDALAGYPLPVVAKDTAGNLLDGILAFIEATDTMVGYFVGANAGTKAHKIHESSLFPLPFFSQLSFQARLLGSTKFIASTTTFGVVKVDTVEFRFGWPLAAMVHASPAPSRGPGNFFMEYQSIPGMDIKIGVGGVVAWSAEGTTEETEVVFDDPSNVGPADAAGDFFNTAACTSKEQAPSGNYRFGDCSEAGNFVLPIRPFVLGANESLTVFRLFSVPGVYEFRNALNGARGRIVVVDER